MPLPTNAPDEGVSPERSDVFEAILRDTAAKIGVDFFQAIVKNLSASLDCWGAWVTEYDPDSRTLASLAFWADGKFIPHYEYEIDGTPCCDVIENCSLHHIPNHAMELYPADKEMSEIGAISYVGMPLIAADGHIMGHIAIMDTKPITDRFKVSIFELFGERATAEMRRIQTLKSVQEREQQLRLLLEGAMDSILLLDDGLVIQKANPSALRVFQCEEEDLIGESILDYLEEQSRLKVQSLSDKLLSGDIRDRGIWIPDKLKALRWDNSAFPAEASLSLFKHDKSHHFCLILRDVNDATESQRRIASLISETAALRETIREQSGKTKLIGQCSSMKRLRKDIERVAATDANVLILGETGVGKELVARSLHTLNQRSSKALVCLNCAALPENLIESELFGHEAGAFTGATSRREGRFKLADKGTLFLDEVGELPLNAQSKLLRVLQEGEFEPIGSNQSVKTDVRVVAATHRDLKALVKEGRFREDLYFRLNVFPLVAPPLRERGDDIELLANEFLQLFSQKIGVCPPALERCAIEALKSYEWPGNVRELQNAIERSLIVSDGTNIAAEHILPKRFSPKTSSEREPASSANRVILTASELKAMEKRNIERALEACLGRVSGNAGAAALLGMKPTTLGSRIKALGITL